MIPSRSYEATGFVVVRSPLLPFAELTGWVEGSVPLGDTTADYVRCRAALVAWLDAAFTRPELAEALFLASPVVQGRLQGRRDGALDDPGLDRVLAAYFTRLCSRETPFGTFAGITLGELGRNTRLELAPRSDYRRHTRLGMGYLVRTLSDAAQLAGVRQRLRYEPNVTLHAAFGRLRFSTFDLVSHVAEAEAYPIVDVEPTPHLSKALARAHGGATLAAIAEALLSPEVSQAEALAFVGELVDHAILVPCWLPTVSGPEPSAGAVSAMSEHPELQASVQCLRATCDRLIVGGKQPLGSQVDELPGLLRDASPVADAREWLQADLLKPGDDLSLGPECVALFLSAADLVQRTGATLRDERLARFCERFRERYAARFVPLVEALDSDLGVGFESFQRLARDAWVTDLVGGDDQGPKESSVLFSQLDQIRLEMLGECLSKGSRECELDARWLQRFPESAPNFIPESFAVCARLSGSQTRPRIIAPTLLAPSAAPLLARFCHADPHLERALRRLLEHERALASDRVLADVVHLPNGHVANVLLRPVLREFEIECGGRSGAPADRRIPVSDLYVGVQGGGVILFSKRLNKRVSVRITNAHNVDGPRNLPLYRFLGALQSAERGLAVGWSWGCLVASPFLPRIRSGDVVLSRACWRLGQPDIAHIVAGTPAQAFARVQALRERLGLPRWVTLHAAAGPLVLDLDNCLSVEMLVHQVRGTTMLALEELLPGPEELALHGPEGMFAGELIVPFLRRPSHPEPRVVQVVRAQQPSAPRPSVARAFLPGSEWLYAKIYTGPSQFDTLLASFGTRLLPSCRRVGLQLWFFVPYEDPSPHIRLRLWGPAQALWGTILPMLEQELREHTQTGLVSKLQLETYEREVERYGGSSGIELTEQVFWADSEACVELIALCQNDPELRWQLALAGIDRLFGDLGLTLEQRSLLVGALLEGYRTELSVSAELKKKISKEYRRHAPRLAELLWFPEPDSGSRRARGRLVLEHRSQRLLEPCGGLGRAADAGWLTRDIKAIASDLAHMHAVRMLGLSVRTYELVIYEYLRRQYATRASFGAPPQQRTQRSVAFGDVGP